MATATFGRRNVVHRAPPMRPAANAQPRRTAQDQAPAQVGEPTELPERAGHPGNPLKATLSALAMIASGVVLIFLFASDLQRDLSLKGTFRPDFNVSVERATCSRYAFVVSRCSVRFSWREGATEQTASGNFLIGLKSMDGVRVIPVRSTADPSAVSSAVALDHLSNRIWTLAFLSGTSLLVGLLLLMKLRRRG
jgi:hypothetical protein